MKITYLGHASLYIETNNKNLLIDPYITENPLATKIKLDQLAPDYILITHGHADHLLDAEKLAKANNSIIISNFEIVKWYEKKGISGFGMNHGGKAVFEFGTIKYVHAIHSSQLPDGSNGGNPGGFVIWNDAGCVYIAGDTALTEDMKLIPMTCPELSLAILPIGDTFTMGYEDAVIASEFLKCPLIMGYHYDTFPPISIDKDVAQKHFTNHDKELILLDIGETLEV